MKGSLLTCVKKTSAAQKTAEEVFKWAEKQGLNIVDVSDIKGKIPKSELKSVRLGLVIGGDGTFLSLVRRLEQKDLFPLMGINLGSLGFITEVGRDEIITATKEALSGKFKEELRPLLGVELLRKKGKKEEALVFNDAVLTKDAVTPMLKFEVLVGGELLSLVRADGYIVSTATGSTAYNLSAGGPLLFPSVKALVLLPICAHSLSARPILVPQETPVEIRVGEFKGAAYLVCDGQVSFDVSEGDKVSFRESGQFLRLVRPTKQKWTEALRGKLKMA